MVNPTAKPLLVVDQLTMRFGGLYAVQDLSFTVHKGEIFGLIGPNGAGKTTVFNCITQFYKATAGTMTWHGSSSPVVLNHLPVHAIISQGIARTFQNVELVWELSVLNNLMVAATSQNHTRLVDHLLHNQRMKQEEARLKEKALNILHYLGLWMVKDLSPYGLPYGVMKRIELARTLMNDPQFIILDEPAAGLNEGETKELAGMIKRLNQELGITIFLVEHDMDLVMSICDRVCAISFGKKLAIGSPQEIRQHPQVKEAYLGEDVV